MLEISASSGLRLVFYVDDAQNSVLRRRVANNQPQLMKDPPSWISEDQIDTKAVRVGGEPAFRIVDVGISVDAKLAVQCRGQDYPAFP